MEMIDVVIARDTGSDTPGGQRVSWRVAPGDFWAVGGLHGSGRSDLVATAGGLQRPAEGALKLFGRDFFELNETDLLRERLRIGIVFENGGRIFSSQTVAENVGLALRYHQDWTASEAHEAIREVLEMTELSPYLHNTPGLLSPNWQQRVGLARALTLKPEILLLDRPLAALDLRHRRWWLEFLGRLSKGTPLTGGRPMTIVATADDLTAWAQHAHQFGILKNGDWHILGGRAELQASQESLARDLWLEDPAADT